MLVKKNNILSSPNKKPILYDVYYKENLNPVKVVVLCHGYKGFKDWGPWHLVAEAFAEAGFCFVKFNFSHNGGTVEQPIDFPDLDAFAENNFSLELDDLDRILNEIDPNNSNKSDIFPEQVESISLIGHSRGGGIVLIKAVEDKRISKVISWAGVSDFKARFREETEDFKQWVQTGVTYVENSRTKQLLPHKFQFYRDFKENEERYTLHKVVKRITIPQLVIHGSEDPTVSLKEAEAIHSWNPESKLVVIDQADHVFGATHPWEEKELPEHLNTVIANTIAFIK